MRTGRRTIRRRLARIDFMCDVHGGPVDGRAAGTLTIVAGKWAYCRASRIIGHRWVATGGIPVTRILTGRVID